MIAPDTKTSRRQRTCRTTLVREAYALVPLIVVTLALFEWAARSEVGHWSLTRLVGVLVLTQLLPGIVIWRAVRPPQGWLLEDMVLGAATGAAIAIPASVLSVVMPFGWLFDWGLGWLGALALVAHPRTRSRVLRASWEALPRWWGTMAAGAVAMLGTIGCTIFTQPMPGSSRWTTQYLDLPFHLALIGDLQHRFPPHTPQVASEQLNYHWFSHAWMAQLGSTSGVHLDVVLLRFVPVVMAVGVTLSLILLGMRLTGIAGAGVLTGYLIAILGPIALTVTWGVSYPVFPLSPSTSFCAFLGAPLVSLLAARWRDEVPGWTWPAIVMFTAAAGGAKGSWLPVLVVGALCAVGVAWVKRLPLWRRVAFDCALIVVTFLVMLQVLFGGGGGSLTVTPFDSLARQAGRILATVPPDGWSTIEVVVLTVLLLASMLLPYFTALGVLAEPEGRWDPAFWLLLGIGAAGVGAVTVFAHPGASQFYFRIAALPYLVIAASWGIFLLWRARHGKLAVTAGVVTGVLLLGPLHRLVPGHGTRSIASGALQLFALLAVLAVLGAVLGRVVVGRECGRRPVISVMVVFLLAGLLGTGVPGAVKQFRNLSVIRHLVDGQPLRTLKAGPMVSGSISRGELRAARYIAAHAAPDDVVMTNRHCRNLVKECDNRHFWIGAYTERRVLIEGWAYTLKNNTGGHGDPDYAPETAAFWDPELLALNDGFITDPTPEAAAKLYELGVRWVYVDRHLPNDADLDGLADRVFRGNYITVYRLPAPDERSR